MQKNLLSNGLTAAYDIALPQAAKEKPSEIALFRLVFAHSTGFFR